MKSDGSLATSEEERLEAWAEYQEKLGSRLEDPALDQRFATEVEAKVSELARLSPTLPASPLDGNFTKEEIKSAITRLKLGKASGADLVTNDMLKIGGDTMLKLLSRLFQWLNEAEVVPEQWCHAIVTNIFKKGDPADPSNYRGISLISCLGKTYLSIWAARLTTHMESQLSEDQGGFRPGRSTIDQVFTLHETLKERREQKKESYLFFVDFRKAFDTVWHNGLWKRLWDCDVRGKLWRIIRSLYRDTRLSVLVDGDMTRYVPVAQGVRQGCPLSPAQNVSTSIIFCRSCAESAIITTSA